MLCLMEKFFDKPVKKDLGTYDNKRKTATGQGIITQRVLYKTILISKNVIVNYNRFT